MGKYADAAERYRMALLRPSGKIHTAIFNNLGWTNYQLDKRLNAELAIEMIKESISLAEPQLAKIPQIQNMKEDPEKHLAFFKGNSKYSAISLANIGEILVRDELGEEVRGYWVTLGLKFAEKFAQEYLPRHLLLASMQYRSKKQVYFINTYQIF